MTDKERKRPAAEDVRLRIRVIPRAATSGVAGTRGDAILVRLNAPPRDGAANDELVRVLSGLLGLPSRAVVIVHGARSRSKIVRVTGMDLETCRNTLLGPQPTS